MNKMLLVVLSAASLMLQAHPAPAFAVTKSGCELGQWEVKSSVRGERWWRCCTVVPETVLRGDARQLCFHCKGETNDVNCDQFPQARPLEEEPVEKTNEKTETDCKTTT